MWGGKSFEARKTFSFSLSPFLIDCRVGPMSAGEIVLKICHGEGNFDSMMGTCALGTGYTVCVNAPFLLMTLYSSAGSISISTRTCTVTVS